ncbi:hypothetical protein FOA52_003480 [Chlamydomonas sp. UWO 241]|nr:hypothetical protein FOA52_003480 [Chlamydomonas sp. UWO 241]
MAELGAEPVHRELEDLGSDVGGAMDSAAKLVYAMAEISLRDRLTAKTPLQADSTQQSVTSAPQDDAAPTPPEAAPDATQEQEFIDATELTDAGSFVGEAEQHQGQETEEEEATDAEGYPAKTQICFDFTKGMCTRGDKCKYTHDLATIVQFNSKEKGICFDYLRNQCQRGLLCRFSHDLSNIAQQCQVFNGTATKGRTNAICYDFVKGVCQRGSECRYSHDLSLIARTARGGANQMRLGEVCYDYLRGRCTRAASCKYSHNMSFLNVPPECMAGGGMGGMQGSGGGMQGSMGGYMGDYMGGSMGGAMPQHAMMGGGGMVDPTTGRNHSADHSDTHAGRSDQAGSAAAAHMWAAGMTHGGAYGHFAVAQGGHQGPYGAHAAAAAAHHSLTGYGAAYAQQLQHAAAASIASAVSMGGHVHGGMQGQHMHCHDPHQHQQAHHHHAAIAQQLAARAAMAHMHSHATAAAGGVGSQQHPGGGGAASHAHSSSGGGGGMYGSGGGAQHHAGPAGAGPIARTHSVPASGPFLGQHPHAHGSGSHGGGSMQPHSGQHSGGSSGGGSMMLPEGFNTILANLGAGGGPKDHAALAEALKGFASGMSSGGGSGSVGGHQSAGGGGSGLSGAGGSAGSGGAMAGVPPLAPGHLARSGSAGGAVGAPQPGAPSRLANQRMSEGGLSAARAGGGAPPLPPSSAEQHLDAPAPPPSGLVPSVASAPQSIPCAPGPRSSAAKSDVGCHHVGSCGDERSSLPEAFSLPGHPGGVGGRGRDRDGVSSLPPGDTAVLSRSTPAGPHPNPANLPPDLMPLLKEIWNKLDLA